MADAATTTDTATAATTTAAANTAAATVDATKAAAQGASTTTAAASTAAATKPAETTENKDAKKGTLITGDGGVPAKYELALPKDTLLDESALERIATLARERGLSQEGATQLLQDESDAVKRFQDGRLAAFVKERDGWKSAVEADKELGGEHLKENAALVSRFAQKWFSKDTLKFLDESGLGNHPMLFRDLLKLAKSSAPDKLVSGSPAGGKGGNKYAEMFPASVGGQTAEVK